MATLEQIRPQNWSLSDQEFAVFLLAFREQRLAELSADGQKTTAKRKIRATPEKIPVVRIQLSPEEKALCKSLGLSYKQLLKLREEQSQ